MPSVDLPIVADTMLAYNSHNNYGAKATCETFGTDNFLLQPDVSAIPPGSVINSASLHINLEQWGRGWARVWRMRQPWAEGNGNGTAPVNNTADWYDMSHGLIAWTTPGATGAGSDREATATAELKLTRDYEFEYLEIPGLAPDITRWLTQPARGWMLNLDNWADVRMRESATPPFVRVVYSVAPTGSMGIYLGGTAGQKDGTLEVPEDGQGITLTSIGSVATFAMRCTDGFETDEAVSVLAPTDCHVATAGGAYGPTASFSKGSIKDTNVLCRVKRVDDTVTTPTWTGLVTSPRLEYVAVKPQ